MKNNKLSIEKFRILEMSNLSNVHGGTSGHSEATETSTDNSATTTYTTDPKVACPTGNTADTTNSNNTIPTLSYSTVMTM
jgi:hypothetical protein